MATRACAELTGYAELRLSKCPFGAAKTTCRECPVHCYRPGEREAMKEFRKLVFDLDNVLIK